MNRRHFRRAIRVALGGAVLACVLPLLSPVTAEARTIAQTKALLASLSAKLSQEEQTSEITANHYDAAKAELARLNGEIGSLTVQEHQKRRAISTTTSSLVTATVRAYVFGAAEAQTIALFNQNLVRSDARTVFENQVIGNLTSLRNTYQAQRKSLDQTISSVATARQKAAQQASDLQILLAQNLQLQRQTQRTLSSVTSQLKNQIIDYEINMGIAAAKKKNTAAENQAIAAASAVGGQAAANRVILAIQAATSKPTITQVGTSQQGLAAVSYAKSQIGVPYVWGGETPGSGFDCSGLVQWAWAKAGIVIPRTTETQWPALQHVSLSALQPGDLLFYYNLDGDHAIDHVVMYVGSGPYGVDTIIAAAHTGTNVSLAPLFTAGLYGAARP